MGGPIGGQADQPGGQGRAGLHSAGGINRFAQVGLDQIGTGGQDHPFIGSRVGPRAGVGQISWFEQQGLGCQQGHGALEIHGDRLLAKELGNQGSQLHLKEVGGAPLAKAGLLLQQLHHQVIRDGQAFDRTARTHFFAGGSPQHRGQAHQGSRRGGAEGLPFAPVLEQAAGLACGDPNHPIGNRGSAG